MRIVIAVRNGLAGGRCRAPPGSPAAPQAPASHRRCHDTLSTAQAQTNAPAHTREPGLRGRRRFGGQIIRS